MDIRCLGRGSQRSDGGQRLNAGENLARFQAPENFDSFVDAFVVWEAHNAKGQVQGAEGAHCVCWNGEAVLTGNVRLEGGQALGQLRPRGWSDKWDA